MKHTPGPWRIGKQSSTLIESMKGRHVATSGGYSTNTDDGEHIEENQANARLIAVAPDLLGACKEFVRKVECGEARSKRSYAQMKVAIAKAEGKE